MSVEETIGGWMFHLSRFAPATQTAYGRVLRRFLKFAPPEVAQITVETIEQFILTFRKSRSARTCNFYLMVLRSWYSWLNLNYGVDNVARRVQRLRTLPPHQRHLEPKEYQQIVKSTTGHVRDCIVFLGNTGLRRAEFMSLAPENINGQFLDIIGKGQKFRRIPVNSTVQAILTRSPNLNFIKSKKRSVKWLNRLCLEAAKTAGVEPFSPHSLRRRFATELYNNGVKIAIISKLLGHSSIQTTEIYLNVSESDLIGATDCLV